MTSIPTAFSSGPWRQIAPPRAVQISRWKGGRFMGAEPCAASPTVVGVPREAAVSTCLWGFVQDEFS